MFSQGDKPKIGPVKPLEIHPAAKVLHYSVEVFEGMKAYYGVDGKIRLFRPDLNMNRLTKSSARSTLPVSIFDCLTIKNKTLGLFSYLKRLLTKKNFLNA